MNPDKRRPPIHLELWLVILIPLLTIVAGAAMIQVATRFGFTALGEPIALAGPAAPAHEP